MDTGGASFHGDLPDSDSSASFIASNPKMLDSKIMLTHYSAEVLFLAGAHGHASSSQT